MKPDDHLEGASIMKVPGIEKNWKAPRLLKIFHWSPVEMTDNQYNSTE